MDSLTSKNLNSSTLCRHWILSRRLDRSDDQLGLIVKETRESVSLAYFDDDDDDIFLKCKDVLDIFISLTTYN